MMGILTALLFLGVLFRLLGWDTGNNRGQALASSIAAIAIGCGLFFLGYSINLFRLMKYSAPAYWAVMALMVLSHWSMAFSGPPSQLWTSSILYASLPLSVLFAAAL